MILENKKTRDIDDAKNVQNSMNEITKSAERKYSIYIPFEVMDFLGDHSAKMIPPVSLK